MSTTKKARHTRREAQAKAAELRGYGPTQLMTLDEVAMGLKKWNNNAHQRRVYVKSLPLEFVILPNCKNDCIRVKQSSYEAFIEQQKI